MPFCIICLETIKEADPAAELDPTWRTLLSLVTSILSWRPSDANIS